MKKVYHRNVRVLSRNLRRQLERELTLGIDGHMRGFLLYPKKDTTIFVLKLYGVRIALGILGKRHGHWEANVFVRKGYRRRGYAKRIISAMKKFAKKRGIDRDDIRTYHKVVDRIKL